MDKNSEIKKFNNNTDFQELRYRNVLKATIILTYKKEFTVYSYII